MDKHLKTTGKTTLQIRPARPSDAKALASYAKRTLASAEHLITKPQEYRYSPLRQRFAVARKCACPDETHFIAITRDGIIGSIECWTDHRSRVRHSTTFTMSVHEAYRGTGVGKKLLLHFINWVQNHPRLERIELHVHADNAAALALYQSVGFTLEGTRACAIRYEDGRVIDDHIMALWP
ncbi:GNAT family N-acetyltransferase [Kordiimonas sp.]|uniref:GNAT family N-acetyltransferase n=1 Tax=Kordiimonas sp. TaxID=1970157 RepID=UPI003A90039E